MMIINSLELNKCICNILWELKEIIWKVVNYEYGKESNDMENTFITYRQVIQPTQNDSICTTKLKSNENWISTNCTIHIQ